MAGARSPLAWGLVGGLSFLVLLQAYELLAGVRVDFGVKLGVAAVVTGAAAGLARAAEPRLVGRNGSP